MALAKGKKRFRTGRIFGKQYAKEVGFNLPTTTLAAAGGLALTRGGRGVLKALARRAGKGGSRVGNVVKSLEGTAAQRGSLSRTVAGYYGGLMAGGIGGAALGARSAEKERKRLGLGGKKITLGRQLLMPGSARLAYRAFRANRPKKRK